MNILENEENQYLNLLFHLINDGEKINDRTGVGTRRIVGHSMRFSLKKNTIPLLTTKRVYWKGIVAELLWFISGSTNAKVLSDQDVHIWDGHSSKEFIESRGFNYPEGEIGPGYGFQWRYAGANYPNTEDGIDQLQNVIDGLKNNPFSRRHIISAWHPNQVDQMNLPPCHLLYQFFVNSDNSLSCIMYQRSCDSFLGVAFNIASASLLTHLIAKVCGLTAKEFVWFGGDVHLYENHIEQAKEQLQRTPREFPKIELPNVNKIEDFTIDNIKLIGYDPYPTIKAEMAI